MTLGRYLLVQIVAYAIDLGTFELLLLSGFAAPVVANLVAKLPAGAFAFVAHRRFTFEAHGSGRAPMEAARYFTLLCVNAPVSSLILAGLLHVVPSATVAKIAADVISVGLTFLLTKHLVFRHRAPGPGRR